MTEVDVINIFKGYSDKKTERSHLAHSWPGLNYMWKAKYKKLGNG